MSNNLNEGGRGRVGLEHKNKTQQAVGYVWAGSESSDTLLLIGAQ